jgi:hypothetical protein
MVGRSLPDSHIYQQNQSAGTVLLKGKKVPPVTEQHTEETSDHDNHDSK